MTLFDHVFVDGLPRRDSHRERWGNPRQAGQVLGDWPRRFQGQRDDLVFISTSTNSRELMNCAQDYPAQPSHRVRRWYGHY